MRWFRKKFAGKAHKPGPILIKIATESFQDKLQRSIWTFYGTIIIKGLP